MEKNPKPVMSAEVGRGAGLGGHLFTGGAERQVRCAVCQGQEPQPEFRSQQETKLIGWNQGR